MVRSDSTLLPGISKQSISSVLQQVESLMALIDEEINVTQQKMVSENQDFLPRDDSMVQFQFQPNPSTMEQHRYSKQNYKVKKAREGLK